MSSGERKLCPSFTPTPIITFANGDPETWWWAAGCPWSHSKARMASKATCTTPLNPAPTSWEGGQGSCALRALSGWGLYLPLEPIHWCYGFTHQCFELGKGESSPEDEKSGFWACRAPELTQHTGEVARGRDATLGAPRWHRPVISAWHQSPFYISSSSARKWRKLKSSEQ